MDDKIRRVRCSTKKCAGFTDTRVSTEPKTKEGNWQFHCSVCNRWNLVSDVGVVKATAQEQFDLERLPPNLRLPLSIKREPPGGV